MKTLEEIKDEYAKSKGYEDWIDLLESNSELEFEINKNVNELLILVQKECLQNAGNNVVSEYERITNENNIIK